MEIIDRQIAIFTEGAIKEPNDLWYTCLKEVMGKEFTNSVPHTTGFGAAPEGIPFPDDLPLIQVDAQGAKLMVGRKKIHLILKEKLNDFDSHMNYFTNLYNTIQEKRDYKIARIGYIVTFFIESDIEVSNKRISGLINKELRNELGKDSGDALIAYSGSIKFNDVDGINNRLELRVGSKATGKKEDGIVIIRDINTNPGIFTVDKMEKVDISKFIDFAEEALKNDVIERLLNNERTK